MQLNILKFILAGLFAGHLLKANRVRSVARFSRAGWVMFFTVFKYARQRDKELKKNL